MHKIVPNKKIKPTGTAIGEFEFSVLAIRFLKYWNTVRRMFQRLIYGNPAVN